MKKRSLLLFAILLLLAGVAWILYDLFVPAPETVKNPYDYRMDTIRASDSLTAYRELTPLKPQVPGARCIAFAGAGKVFVGGQGRVELLSGDGRLLNRFSIAGSASCMVHMDDGNLAIGMDDHLEIWSPGGVKIAEWPAADSASILTSVAAGGDFIYVADAGMKVVYQYDRKGTLLSKIGQKDPVRKIPGFIIPSPYFDVAVSPSGDLWVANTGRYRLEKYGADGALLTAWGEPSFAVEGFAGCCNPSHFAIMPDGSFVTAEKGIERVKIYSPSGVYQCLVAGPESFDEGTRGLDLAAGTGGVILVLDPERNQVRIFVPQDKR